MGGKRERKNFAIQINFICRRCHRWNINSIGLFTCASLYVESIHSNVEYWDDRQAALDQCGRSLVVASKLHLLHPAEKNCLFRKLKR